MKLAFSILVHENVGIFETLLHMIFRPQHSYCVHIDSKAKQSFHLAVRKIIQCFQVGYTLDYTVKMNFNKCEIMNFDVSFEFSMFKGVTHRLKSALKKALSWTILYNGN